MADQEGNKNRHDRFAPYWAAALFVLCSTGLATIWFDFGLFWKGYVLDMVGPAWSYILFRGLFTAWKDNPWTRFFTPGRTVVLFLIFCFCVEGAQYMHLYESTFDPWDFPAYISILIPLFILDSWHYTPRRREGSAA